MKEKSVTQIFRILVNSFKYQEKKTLFLPGFEAKETNELGIVLIVASPHRIFKSTEHKEYSQLLTLHPKKRNERQHESSTHTCHR